MKHVKLVFNTKCNDCSMKLLVDEMVFVVDGIVRCSECMFIKATL